MAYKKPEEREEDKEPKGEFEKFETQQKKGGTYSERKGREERKEHEEHEEREEEDKNKESNMNFGKISYEVKEDSNTKKWTVYPAGSAGRGTEANWLIECNSRDDAYALKRDLLDGKVKTPIEAPNYYGPQRTLSNGKTVYACKTRKVA